MKTFKFNIQVEVPNNFVYTDIMEWLNGHIDNIPYEMLEEDGYDPELVEEVEILGVFPS